MRRIRYWLLLTFMIMMLSTTWITMKISLIFVSPLTFLTHRCFLATIVLIPVLVFRSNKFSMARQLLARLLVYGMMNATGMAMSTIGLAYETTGLSSLLTYTHPLFVFFLAVVFLKEEPFLDKTLGVFIGFLGVTMLFVERISLALGRISSIYPMLFLLLGAFLWASSMVYFKAFLKSMDQLLVTCLQFLFAAILAFLVTLISEGLTKPFDLPITYFFSLSYTSICGMALATLIMLTLLKQEEAIVVSASCLIVPVLATFLAFVILQEGISELFIPSSFLILVGLYLVNRRRGKFKSLP